MDVCADARPPYYVMAYAPNGSLADRLEKGPMNLAEALAIFRQVTAALDYVHTKGIRHCDLKPANILLDARGNPLIADFGQAHLSSGASPVLGTFFYMAPEQADLTGQIPDTRWDVYGLGALFYAMLTGAPPRENAALRDQMRATPKLSHRLQQYREWIPQAPPPRAHRRVRGMDRALAQIIERCLEVDPKRRLPNAGAVLTALKLRERRRRQRPLLLFGLTAPLVLLAVVTGMEFSNNEATVAQVETKLTGQLLESDRNSARLIANAVQENLRSHLDLLFGSATKESGLHDAIVGKDKKAVAKTLRRLMRRSQKANLKYSQAAASDNEGHVLAIVNLDPKDGRLSERYPDALGCRQFAWRDWFSGQGDRWDEMYLETPRTPSDPITAPHISDPYVSLPDKYMFINISIPVRDPDKLEVRPVGVLTASIKLDDINQWLIDVKMEHGFAVLLDKRRCCLLHRDGQAIRRPGVVWACGGPAIRFLPAGAANRERPGGAGGGGQRHNRGLSRPRERRELSGRLRANARQPIRLDRLGATRPRLRAKTHRRAAERRAGRRLADARVGRPFDHAPLGLVVLDPAPDGALSHGRSNRTGVRPARLLAAKTAPAPRNPGPCARRRRMGRALGQADFIAPRDPDVGRETIDRQPLSQGP